MNIGYQGGIFEKLAELIYVEQPEGFTEKGKENFV